MIDDKDISIVVQGPILTHSKFNATAAATKLVCTRLRKLFPGSQLILSTWEGENVAGIPYDQVIFNVDPGATWFDNSNHNVLNNCNRLIVSTLGGIKQASRKYVFKLRSDLFLMSKKFLNYFNHYDLYNEEYKFVKSRILAFSMWSIRGHKSKAFTMQKPFHISDWAYFGYKDDLLNLYNVELIPEPDFSQWFLHRCKPFFDINPQNLWKMPPEQYITSSFFKKYTAINLEHMADVSNENAIKSAKLLMNNFLVLDQSQFFCISLKHFCFQFSRENYEWFIYHSTWLQDYYDYITTHSALNKLKYKLQRIIRGCTFFLISNSLRVVNKKNKFIARFMAYFVKRWAYYNMRNG